jgi:hypothetical protein
VEEDEDDRHSFLRGEMYCSHKRSELSPTCQVATAPAQGGDNIEICILERGNQTSVGRAEQSREIWNRGGQQLPCAPSRKPQGHSVLVMTIWHLGPWRAQDQGTSPGWASLWDPVTLLEPPASLLPPA